MKALSIRQPWAWLICCGMKDVENRTWSTKYRGPFLVHAPFQMDHRFLNELREKEKDLPIEASIRGGIIGRVELVDVVTKSESPWFFGPYGFLLKNPQLTLERFHACKGALGFWEYKR